MDRIQFTITRDHAATIVDALQEFGSLAPMTREEWERVVGFLLSAPHGHLLSEACVRDAASVISDKCEFDASADIWPQPPKIATTECDNHVAITTPASGTVIYLCCPDDGQIHLDVNFGRDSQYAAFRVLSGLHRRHSGDAALTQMLRQWASESHPE